MSDVKKAAVVGGGLIGMSWASLFLARGIDVVVVDPSNDAKDNLEQFVAKAWPLLKDLGLTISDEVRHADFVNRIDDLRNIDFVQEMKCL